MRTVRSLALALLAVAPSLAFAHEGHEHGFVAAFMHPMLGWDHLLAMVLVGVLAARHAGRAAIALPVGFVGGAGAGALLGLTLASGGGAPAWLEPAIAGSVMLLGLAAAITWRAPLVLATLACTLFGAVHGFAHGIELQADAAPVLAGMLLATALLHAAGYVIARAASVRAPSLVRIAGLASGAVAVVALTRLA